MKLSIYLITIICLLSMASAATTLEISLSLDEHDQEQPVGGNCNGLSSDLELGKDSSNQYVIFHFDELDVPQGATIDYAYLELQAQETASTAGSIVLYAEDADDGSAPVNGVSQCIEDKTATTNGLAYDPVDWTAGTRYNTSNISNIIEEVTDRTGWSANNSLNLIFENLTFKLRNVVSRDGDDTAAAKLYLSYSNATAPQSNTSDPYYVELNDCLNAHTANSFTIIQIPDTQTYAEVDIEPFHYQTNWILNHTTDYKIGYAIHTGDVVDSVTTQQYDRANESLSYFFNESYKFAMVRGNHDSSHSFYNNYFPVSRFLYNTNIKANYNDNDNNYHEFSAGGYNFSLMAMSYEILENEYDWFNNTIDNTTMTNTIIATHEIHNHTASGELHGDGVKIYEKVKSQEDVWLLMGAGASIHVRTNETFDGHTIYAVTTNFQYLGGGAQGYFNVINFYPDEDIVNFQAYSPYLDVCDKDFEYNVTYELVGEAEPPGDTTAPVISDVSAGSVGITTARAVFTTDEPANVTLTYTDGNASNGTVTRTTFKTSHSVLMSGLSSNTSYNFSLVSVCDNSGNCASSYAHPFTTLSPSSVSVTPSTTTTLLPFIVIIMALSIISFIYVFFNDKAINDPFNITMMIIAVIIAVISLSIAALTIGGI